MSRRVVDKTRPVVDGQRQVNAPGAPTEHSALDAPVHELVLSRDGKRLYALHAYEVSVLHAQTLEFIRSIEVPNERPSLTEAPDGEVWIGGHHLYRCQPLAGRAQKAGARLGGWVDRVAFVRADLLLGIGQSGEVLWSPKSDAFEHQRALTHVDLAGPVVLPNQHAVFADASASAWIIDPAHPQGYTQLHFKRTSVVPVADEAIIAVHADTNGRVVLAAVDGGIALTTERLTLAREFFPRAPTQVAKRHPWESSALAVTNDERWIYVLRPGGELHRYLIAQPTRPKEQPSARTLPSKPMVIDPLPPAQYVVLSQPADAMVMVGSASHGEEYHCECAFAGRRGDGQLGTIWRQNVEALPWQPLSLRERSTIDVAPPPTPPAPPSFITLRTKPKGPALKTLAVDDVLSTQGPLWLCAHHGPLLDRPTQVLSAEHPALPGDTLVLPAMLRPVAGTARPGLVLWPGSPDDEKAAEEAIVLAWGDSPRAWLPLNTLHLREQRWSRSDVFPCEVVLRNVPQQVPGKRRPLPPKWQIHADAFATLAQECKRLLKVIW